MTRTQTQIDAARAVLTVVERQASLMGVLGAAALAATAAVLLAGVMILGPGVAISEAQPVAAVDPV